MSTTGGAQAAAAAAESAPVEATGTFRGSGFGKEPTALSDFLARFDHKVIPYVLISPFFILFTAFGLYPLFYNGVVSFQNWTGFTNQGWIGFTNYSRVFGDAGFWRALGNTFGIFLLSTVPQLLLALILAALLNRRLRAQNFFRVGILLPYVTPIVASTLIFAQVFGRDHGIINSFLGNFGIHHTTPSGGFNGIDWRNTSLSSWTAIATMVNWKWIGYNALLYLSAMQSIPKDVYEAAALDGAGAWKQLWKITVPMIRPMVLFTVVLSTIGGLQLFTEPMLFEQNAQAATGGTHGQWQTVAQLIYKTGWKVGDLSYAAAMSWVMFFIIVILAGFNALIANRLGGGGR